MGPNQTTRPIRAWRRALRLVPIVALVFVGGSGLAACSGDHAAATSAATWTFGPGAVPAATAAAATATDGMAMAGMPMTAAETAAWSHRPAYTGSGDATEAAYAYALRNPKIMAWIPCYCGCVGAGHRSNLDCYLKPTTDGSITFEEHASYCDVCVQITLKTRDLLAQGMFHDARAAIDATFGGNAPGTATEVPPV